MARGGGRSGGGGSSRSFGSSTRRAGSSSGSSRTHRGAGVGGFGGSRPSSGGFGGFGGSRGYGRPAPPPRPRRAWFGGYRAPRYGGYGGYGGGYAGGGGGCGGCLGTLVMLVFILMLAAVLMPASCMTSFLSSSGGGAPSGQVAQVTHTHEKLAASECDLSDAWLDDRANWIDDTSTVVSALRYFYEKTGSQPYLVVATDIDGKTDFTDAEGEDWANDIYDEQFSDDGHTVVAFVEYEESEYAYYIVAGRSAQSVIDQEAREIIADEINYWYTDTSLDDSAYFAKVFRESADTIMFDYEQTTKTVNTRRRVLVIGLGVVGVAAVLGILAGRTSKRKKEEYEEARKLAETPVSPATPPAPTTSSYPTSGSTTSELEEFERKYGSD